jgi:alkylation response protein AidB-like acyl-CoA dehydrogenase
MPSYEAPLPEFRFLLQEVLAYEERVATLPGCEEATMDLVMPVLQSAGVFARDVLVPINNSGDNEGCTREGGTVRTPHGYLLAYAAYRDAGWPALAGDPACGGQGLPITLSTLVREIIGSGSMAFGMYGGLSQGAYRALLAHGSEALRRKLLPPLVDGRWTGTMCLTEAESGSDLSRLRTRETPAGDGTYRINGSKIFISGGDHDLAENILHLVLARLPDAPAGTRGISLFLVPKKLPRDDGTALPARSDNRVSCTSIEHKMGIRASATAALGYIHEHGMERLLRDAQIVPLCEGTNAIQALDLVHRKLALEDGKVIADWLAETGTLVRSHAERAKLRPLCEALDIAACHVKDSTALMQQRAREDAISAAAAASDYLRLFGLVALGAAWLRMGAVALDAKGGESPAFYAAKVGTARFCGEYLLGQTCSLSQGICADASVLMGHTTEEL